MAVRDTWAGSYWRRLRGELSIQVTGPGGKKLDLPEESSFPATAGLRITGRSTAQTVHYAAVIPGAVVDQGSLTVNGGKFEYRFDPVATNQATPTYDITNLKTGRPEIFDVVHLTFFSKEQAPGGGSYHSYTRVIIRGTRVLYIR